MSCSPTSRRGFGRIGTAAISAVLAVAVVFALSCRDEITPPTHGTVRIVLSSPNAGGVLGTRVVAGNNTLIPSAEREIYDLTIPAGTYEFRAFKDCSRLDPAEPRQVTVEAGHTVDLRWEIQPSQAIEVFTSIPGAAIRLDGVETGLLTPNTIACVQPGSHEVGVSLLGASTVADSAKTVTVGDAAVRVDFELAPRVQPRTALLEIFTATYCPNCGAADAAAALLWQRYAPAQDYLGIQVHTRWGGRDSIQTPETLERNLYYGDQERQGIPAAIFGGTLLHRGAGQMSAEEIADVYAEYVDSVRATPTPVSLYWIEAVRTPASSVHGRARVMLSGVLESPADCHLWAAVYKDSLRTRGVEGENQLFRHNVRTYLDAGSLASLSVQTTGHYADVDFEWPSFDDQRPSGALWSESEMGIVVFVQNMATKEILQAAHAPLP